MVRIPAGSFMMGSEDGDVDERPVHNVTLASFEMDVTEVTVKAYKACVDAGRCSKPDTGGFCNWGRVHRDTHPVNCVDWTQARAFCSWAGKRLPTEEEWEYAARGTDGRTYPWGNDAHDATRLCSTRSQGTCEVGQFLPGDSPFGLHDMAGNVWEWTGSRYCSYSKPGCSEAAHVHRGGSWNYDSPSFVRAANRVRYDPSLRNDFLGFRCAR